MPTIAPKERVAPLKDEYVHFHQEVTRYHDRVEGYLFFDDCLNLASQLPDVPNPLDSFTDKATIVAGAADLIAYVSDVRALYDEVHRNRAKRATSSTMSGSAIAERSAPEVVLPTSFDGSSAKARTFLAECNHYIDLNSRQFSTDSVKIQWALQMCTDKAANWKRIQLELANGYDPPEYLFQ